MREKWTKNNKCTLCRDKCTVYSIKFNACYTRLLEEKTDFNPTTIKI